MDSIPWEMESMYLQQGGETTTSVILCGNKDSPMGEDIIRSTTPGRPANQTEQGI